MTRYSRVKASTRTMPRPIDLTSPRIQALLISVPSTTPVTPPVTLGTAVLDALTENA